MMGYHIEASRSGFKELPDKILVREDGWLGAYKFDGEPIVDYWYVPEQRVDELAKENERLRELVSGLEYCTQGHVCDSCPLYDTSGTNHRRCESLEQELGIEVPDA